MFLDDVPQVVGQKNASKFTPHIAQLRTGNLSTVTEMIQIYQFILNQEENNQFGLALDDRTYEDVSVIQQD